MAENAERVEPWTIKELAEAAGVDASYIRRLCIQGKLEGAKKPARDWLIPAQVGADWLKQKRARWEKW
jgi:hypothetical protein